MWQFLSDLFGQAYEYVASIVKWTFGLFQALIDVIFAGLKSFWDGIFIEWAAELIYGENGFLIWLLGLSCQLFEFLIDKVPDIVLPVVSVAAYKSIVGYVVLVNEVLPVFEGWLILISLIGLWSVIVLIRIVIKLFPTIG